VSRPTSKREDAESDSRQDLADVIGDIVKAVVGHALMLRVEIELQGTNENAADAVSESTRA